MPSDNGRLDAPAEAALAPFRCYAAFLAWTQEARWRSARPRRKRPASLMDLGAQQARIRLAWAEAAGQALATWRAAAPPAQAGPKLERGAKTQEGAIRE